MYIYIIKKKKRMLYKLFKIIVALIYEGEKGGGFLVLFMIKIKQITYFNTFSNSRLISAE